MSGNHHHRSEPTTPSSPPSAKRSRKDESNGGGVVVVSSSSSFFPLNSLPMDVLVLIFEYIPQYPRLRVVKFVSKRFHSAVLRSFKTISFRDFRWNWKFVLPRFPCITSIDIPDVEPFDLPDVLPPRLDTLKIVYPSYEQVPTRIETTSSLTSLSLYEGGSCFPLDRLFSNSLSSLTFLSLDGFIAPPSTLYLPALRHLVIYVWDKELIMNHASQLTRLQCIDVSYLQGITFPSLRHLDVPLRSHDNTSFLQHCPSLTHLNATLSHNGSDVNQVTHLLPLVSTISWGAGALLPFLHLATRLTAIDSGPKFDEHTMQHLLPVASRLKILSLVGWRHDCAAILALCPMLEELKLSNPHIYSHASLSLPHLVKMEIDLTEYSSKEAFECLNKFLVVAPRLRQVLVVFVRDQAPHDSLVSDLQAAERAGVERIEIDEQGSLWRGAFATKLQWLRFSERMIPEQF